MPVSRSYRCLNCMDHSVERSYDVSHLSRTCDACGEFGRFVNQRVLDQFETFEADPPEALDWAALDRKRKLLVAERVARTDRSVEDLAPRDPANAGDDAEGAGADEASAADTDGDVTAEDAAGDESDG